MNKNEFIEKNYKLIVSACNKYHKMCNGYIEFEDFLNNCCLLFLTRKSFNPDINNKPSPFIYKVVLMEALTVIRRNQSQKRKISQGDLMSLDFIYNNENSSKSDFKENSIVKTYDDDSIAIANELIDLIKNRLTDEQKIEFNYMLKGYNPKDVNKLTGKSTQTIHNNRVMIKRKAKNVIERYYRIR